MSRIPQYLSSFSSEGDEVNHLIRESNNLSHDPHAPLHEQRNKTRKAIGILQVVSTDDEKINEAKNKYVTHLELLTDALQNADERLDGEISDEEIQKHISDFVEREKKRWEKTPYTNEEILGLFTEEHLKQLDLDDYILLMKRFPGEVVTHVTRQGIRDHTDLPDHFTNQGMHHDSFEKILDERRLHSMMQLCIRGEIQDEEVLERFLNNPATKEEALDHAKGINSISDEEFKRMFGAQGSLSDQAAIHFASEQVLDHYYGSERENEIFLVYPSVFVASQFKFMNPHKSSHDLMPMSSNRDAHIGDLGAADKYTDLFVWTENQKGIDLDAGIAFIPANADVDPVTGSQYVLDDQMKPNEKDEFTSEINKLAQSKVCETEWNELFIKKYNKYEKKSFKEKIDIFFKKIGISFNPHIKMAIRKYLFHDENGGYVSSWDETKKRLLKKFDVSDSDDRKSLFYYGALFERAKTTIKSKQFWEKYFEKNPERKPKKIVYYDGDPTVALNRWREQNGITPKLHKNKALSTHAGFSTNLIHTQNRQADCPSEDIDAEDSPDGLLLVEDRKAITAVLRQIIDRHFE